MSSITRFYYLSVQSNVFHNSNIYTIYKHQMDVYKRKWNQHSR